MANEKSEDIDANDSVIDTAKKRFQLAEEYSKDNHKSALDDWKFRSGEQWPDEIKRERMLEGRPTIVINRILQPIRQITNDQRQNRPSIKVHPVDDNADIEVAKIYQGMIRHIEQDSNADVAYDTAFEGAAVGGLGYFRIYTDYCDPMSFEQQAKIGLIEDWSTVRFDPFSKQPDGSDANWAFIGQEMPKEEFIAEFGESKLAQNDDWNALSSEHVGWVKKDAALVVEYFYKEFKTVKIYQLATGETVSAEEFEELKKSAPVNPTEEELKGLIANERVTKVPIIKWVKMNGLEILDQTEFPGRFIPIIPVYGDKFIIDGKRILEGIVRHSKDSQRMYNLHKSSEAEVIGLSPKAPWIVAEGQIPPEYANQWKQANRKTYSHLTYKPTTFENHLVPPPQRNVYEAPIQAITQAGMYAADEIKATTGIFDAAMGNQSNETSGVAIQRRAAQGQTANYHLIDNLTRSIRHCGRILVDIIPFVYDTARAARIIGEEGEEEIIRINEEFERRGERVTYQLSAGKYDVSVDTGPNFATKRQEASQSMLELSKAAPVLMQAAPDLLVKNFDFPGAQEIADRLKKTLAPGLAEDKDKKPLPPEVQAQMQQMSTMIEQLTGSLNEANETIRIKKLEIESKERIEFAKLENDLLIEKMKQAKAMADMQIERQLQELDSYQHQKTIEEQGFAQPGQEQPQPAGVQMPGAEEQI